MTRIGCIAMWLLVAAGAHAPGSAAAQGDPDLREILPYLMLVIDTSGSMERLPACSCSTAGCLECLPNCNLPNDPMTLQPPTDPPNDPNGRELKKNRWATTLEALTGTFNDFQCETLLRTTENGATYDVGYFTPYNQPWDCSTAGTACPFTSLPATYQNSNGILDQYATRVRFGLMTFDGMDTYLGATSQVLASAWDNPRSNAVQGLWSFGDPRPINYPGCTNDYMMNTGARGPQALEGSLVSLDSCSGGGAPGSSPSCPSWCSSCSGTQDVINREIQEALLSTRPFGGTPIAGSLHDLYAHFQTGLNDQFGGCRNRFALLVTDGEPDDDYRNDGCNCDRDVPVPPVTYLDRCGAMPIGYDMMGEPLYDPEYDPKLKRCPYPTAEEAARELVQGRPATSEPAMIERLFVVGMAVDQPAIQQRLDAIADEGCLEDEEVCDADNDNHQALFADDLDGLVENLSAVINSLIEPISRSVPAFAAGNVVGNAAGARQYQISTGFEVATEPGHPWTGVIERRRFGCFNGALVESPLDNVQGDRFHVTLNDSTEGDERVLWTATDPGGGSQDWGPNLGGMNGHLYIDPNDVDAPCGDSDGCPEKDLSDMYWTSFGSSVTSETEADAVKAWMRGDDGTVRADKKLGDIYHSSPVIVGSPQFDTTDEAFNAFRQSNAVARRPLTMYVGSNDGILHAFSVEPYSTPAGVTPPTTYVAGQEMWGFVPPLLLDDVPNYRTAHAFSMDATPVVKNVYLERTVGAQASPLQYRTILIAGMREGGRAYVALDVTDPIHPQFLWQFTDQHMGLTFGQPAIVQARYSLPDDQGVLQVKQGAVAILPGGVGELGAVTGECSAGRTDTMRKQSTSAPFETFPALDTGAQALRHRFQVRCWLPQGRALYFVEVKTGILIKKIYLDPDNGDRHFFPSPLVSAPAVYPAETGALTTQAFIVDADGVIWRIDMSAEDQRADSALPHGEDDDAHPREGWTARPFHDIFFETLPENGELTYEAPILSVDGDGRVVVIVGTGDNNNFVKPTVHNKVVSLTQLVMPSVSGPERFVAGLNWEMKVTNGASGTRLTASELVTGTMALFNGTLFFATFQAISGGDACDLGKGRIHAVHYRNRDTAANPNGGAIPTYPPLLMQDLAIGASASIINVAPEAAVDNLMLMGLGLTQRPSCIQVDTESFDVWDQDLTSINQLAPPAIFLVAQGSGNTGTGTLLQDRAGSRLGSVELQVDRPASMSRVVSWATSVD
jgi:type IV pilus assembly protein PilY1